MKIKLLIVILFALVAYGCQAENQIIQQEKPQVQESNNPLFRLQGINNFTYSISIGSGSQDAENQIVTYQVNEQNQGYEVTATYSVPDASTISFTLDDNFVCQKALHVQSQNEISCDADVLFGESLRENTHNVTDFEGEHNFDEINLLIDADLPVPKRIIVQRDIERTVYTYNNYE